MGTSVRYVICWCPLGTFVGWATVREGSVAIADPLDISMCWTTTADLGDWAVDGPRQGPALRNAKWVFNDPTKGAIVITGGTILINADADIWEKDMKVSGVWRDG